MASGLCSRWLAGGSSSPAGDPAGGLAVAVVRSPAGHGGRALQFALDPPLVIKTGPTRRLVGLNWWERQHVCEVELPPRLVVPSPARVCDRAILLYDDVFTDGLLLNAVARKLREAGAATVCQVTLARQPWAW